MNAMLLIICSTVMQGERKFCECHTRFVVVVCFCCCCCFVCLFVCLTSCASNVKILETKVSNCCDIRSRFSWLIHTLLFNINSLRTQNKCIQSILLEISLVFQNFNLFSLYQSKKSYKREIAYGVGEELSNFSLNKRYFWY